LLAVKKDIAGNLFEMTKIHLKIVLISWVLSIACSTSHAQTETVNGISFFSRHSCSPTFPWLFGWEQKKETIGILFRIQKSVNEKFKVKLDDIRSAVDLYRGIARAVPFLCHEACSDYHLGTIWVIMGIIVTIYSFMGNFGYKYGYEHNKYQNNPGNSIPNR
jgi:hypothetical protein